MTTYISLVRQPVFNALEARVSTLESDILAAQPRVTALAPAADVELAKAQGHRTTARYNRGLVLSVLASLNSSAYGTIGDAEATVAAAIATSAAADAAAPPRLNDLLMIGL